MKAQAQSIVPGARFWVRDHGAWQQVTVTATQQTPKGLKAHWVDEQGKPGKGMAAALYAQKPTESDAQASSP